MGSCSRAMLSLGVDTFASEPLLRRHPLAVGLLWQLCGVLFLPWMSPSSEYFQLCSPMHVAEESESLSAVPIALAVQTMASIFRGVIGWMMLEGLLAKIASVAVAHGRWLSAASAF